MTPIAGSLGCELTVCTYGNGITPVTEMTSLRTAGNDMPLESPTLLFPALFAPRVPAAARAGRTA